MGLLNGSLQIGQSAIRANQAALQIIGNNVANAANPNYSRQRPILEPVIGGELTPGVQSGLGVEVSTVQRMADEAVNARLRLATSDQAFADAASGMLSQMETVFNALGEDNLSTRLTDLFNAFNEVANAPQSSGRRTMLLQAGDAIVRSIRSAQSTLTDQRIQINQQITAATNEANSLLGQIADLNGRITRVEFGMHDATAGSLRDQRDALLGRLSELIGVTTHTGAGGAINVYLDSTPLVLGSDSFELTTGIDASNGFGDILVKFVSTDSAARVTNGKIGGLMAVRDGALQDAVNGLNDFSVGLINEVNRIHSQGQGLVGYGQITSTNGVSNAAAALDAAGLPLTPANGVFKLSVTDANGVRTEHVVKIDLLDAVPKTTLSDLVASLDGLAHVTASADADGRLSLSADSGYTLSFGEDTSGVLAALGLNTFFSGSGAHDIAVRPGLTGSQIAASSTHQLSDNSNALRLSQLGEQRLDSMGNITLQDFYGNVVGQLASQSADAASEVDASAALVETLVGQRNAISGVSIDEEAIDLMKYQRAFQGAAHFLSLVNEMLDELVRLV